MNALLTLPFLQRALLALGSPLWIALILAAAGVVFSLYISLWSVVVSLWAVFASLIACIIACVLACGIQAAVGNGAASGIMLAGGFICAGLAIFAFWDCRAVTKATVVLTGKIAVWIKNRFIRKEEA